MKKEFEDTKTKQGRKKGRGKKEQDEVSGENLNEEKMSLT